MIDRYPGRARAQGDRSAHCRAVGRTCERHAWQNDLDLNELAVDRLDIASVIVRPVLDRRRRGNRERSIVDGAVGRARVGSVGRVDDLGDARATRVIYS